MKQNYLSIEETANMLSVHPRTIRRYLKNGVVEGVKIGGKWHISQEDIQRMLGRTDVSGELEESWSRQAVEHIQGAPSPIDSRFRVCAITDCDFVNAGEAAEVSQALLAIINSRDNAKAEARLQYHFDQETNRGRFILWGDPEFIQSCMVTLNHYIKRGDIK